MRKIYPPNLAASDAVRARKDVIVNVLVSDAKTPVSVLINASARTKAMVEKDAMDDIWVSRSRRMRPVQRPRPCFLGSLLVAVEAQIRARRGSDNGIALQASGKA